MDRPENHGIHKERRMTQAAFTFDAPHQTCSATSRAAAEAIAPAAGTLRATVLAYLVRCEESGATDEEMQTAIGMAQNTQRPRRGELVRAGFVRDSGKTRPTRSGRNASVWIATGGVQ
jgi:hypothetical protein